MYRSTTTYRGKKISIFLAGGITGCPNWQTELTNLLKNEDVVILNPRKKYFPINDPNVLKSKLHESIII